MPYFLPKPDLAAFSYVRLAHGPRTIRSALTKPLTHQPELTTTNNRALLQFSSEFASTASSSLCKIPPKTRLFALSFK